MVIEEFLFYLYNWILPAYAVMIAFFIGIKIIRYMKSRGKIPCIVVHPHKRMTVEYLKPEQQSVKPSDATKATKFKSGDFVREAKPLWKFWRLAKDFLIFGLNADRALHWEEGTESALKSMWTDSEVKKYVAKMVAKARVKAQLISNVWGIMIVVLLISILFLVFMGFNRIGAF